MKSGNLNFLEPSGPLQACNGTALPFLMRKRDIKLVEVFQKWHVHKRHIVCPVSMKKYEKT
jgi:hypothetical protein